MSVRSRIASLWRILVHGSRAERELDDEMGAVLEILTDEKIREGMRMPDARRAAALELGGRPSSH